MGATGDNIGDLGKSSRKPKQKKVPQRGLGVAQLERIIIEEQQRKEAEASVSPTKSSSLPLLSIPNFHHSNQLAMACGSPSDFAGLDGDDAKASSTVVSFPNSGKSFETALNSIPVVHGNLPKFCDFEKEFLSCESNPTWLFPNWTQTTQQYQQPCLQLVNVSSGILSPVNYYSIKEPPSNQNFSTTSCVPLKPEEKMIGLKRSYPFSLDVPPPSSFNYNLPTFTSFMKTKEPTSSGRRVGMNFAAVNSTFREVPSCSALNSEKSNEEGVNFNGDFLTLAPPCPHFESPFSQGKLEDRSPHDGQRCSSSQFNLHNFFPPKAAATQVIHTATSSKVENCNGGKGESVDLNLKL